MKVLLFGILFLLLQLPAVELVAGINDVAVTVTPEPADRIFRAGAEVEFGLRISFDGGELAYKAAWRKVGRVDTLSKEETLKLSNLTGNESGKYYCVVYENGNNLPYMSDTVDIQVIDTKVNAYGFTRLCIGDRVEYAVSMSDDYAYSYSWYQVGADDAVSEQEKFVIDPIAASHAGKYYCVVHDDTHGFDFWSDTLDISVSDYPSLAIFVNGVANNANKTFTFCYDSDVALKAVNGKPGQANARYLWTGSSITGQPGDASVKVILKRSGLYRAVITNNGCVREDSVKVVMKRPGVILPESRYMIEGDDLSLESSVPDDNYKYFWSKGETENVSNASEFSFNVPEGKTRVILKVQTNDALKCENSDTCNVVGLPAMNYTTSKNDGYVTNRGVLDIIQSDTTLCARQPLTLEVAYTGYDGYTYEWMKIDGSSTTVVDTGRIMNIASAALTAGVRYFCRAQDVEQNGYVYSDTVKVVVDYAPMAKITEPDGKTGHCGGYPVTLKGKDAAANNPLVRYQWEGSGIVSGSNTAELQVKLGVNGYYRLVLAVNKCTDTTEINIPTIVHTVDIASQLILSQPTNNVAFVAAKPEDGMLTWFSNGDALRKTETGKNPSVALNVLAGDTVVVVKMEKAGCVYYDTCRVLIREFKPVADVDAQDDGFAISLPILRVTATDPRVCLGRDIDLAVYDLGYDNYKYEWRKVGTPDKTGLSDSISYTIFRAKATDAGKYYCVAVDPENPGVLIYSDTLNLVLSSGPVAEIARDYTSLCYGDIIEIKALTDYVGSGSSSDPTVADVLTWEGPGILSGQGTNSIQVKVGTEARYTLTASKNSGCWSQDTISFPVGKPAVTITPPVTFLHDAAEVKLTAQTDATDIEWSQNGVLSPVTGKVVSMLFNEDGHASVKVTQEKCIARDTVYVFIKQQSSYAGGENDGFIISRPLLTIPSELKTIYACPDTLLTFRVTHPEFPNYKYQWWKLKPGGGSDLVYDGEKYTFNVKDTDGGRYYCTVMESDAADGNSPYIYSDTLYLQVNNGPVAEIAFDKLQTCIGVGVHLDASASASGVGGVVTYRWTGEGVKPGQEQLAAVEVVPEKETVYTVRVSNSVCSDTASVRVTVVRPKIEIPSRLQLAAPNHAYAVKATIPANLTVEWSFRADKTGTSVPGNGPLLDITGDGWAIARSSTADGCVGYDSCRVFVKVPVSFAGGNDDGYSVLEVSTRIWLEPQQEELEFCLNQEMTLRAMVSGLSHYEYSWHRVEDDADGKPGHVLDTIPQFTIEHLQQNQAGRYYCIVTDIEDVNSLGENRSYHSDTIAVKIKDGPVASITRLDGLDVWSACVGNSIELRGELKNPDFVGGAITYQWSGDYFEETNDAQVITASPRGNGIYALAVSDSKSGCSDTLQIQFEMHAPVVNIPETYQLSKAENLEIRAMVEGEGQFTWYRKIYNPANPFSSSNPVSLLVQQDEAVIVRFEQNGCFGFDTTQVFVKHANTFIGGEEDGFMASALQLKAWVEQKNQNVCRGSDIEIPLHVADVGRVLRYKWYKVGDPSHTILSEKRTLVLRANSISDAGEYYCVVADPALAEVSQKTVNSDTATVAILNGPLAEISRPTANELKGIFCRGSEVIISAVATEGKKVSSNDAYVYEWFGENISYSAYNYEISARMGSSGRYIVKASMGECYTYDTVMLNIYEPKVDIQPVIFLSKTEEVQLSVKNPEKNRIRWSFYYNYMSDVVEQKVGDTLKVTVREDAYVVVERIENQCTGYDTCRIFVRDERSFTGGEEDGFMSKGSGFYYKPIEYTDEVCEGSVATLYVPVVGDDFYRYKWTKVGDEARVLPATPLCKFDVVTKNDEGYYYCTITDVNSNRSLITDRVYMTVKEMPKSSILVDDKEICFGETITLKADATLLKAGVSYSYLWSGKALTSRIAPETQVKVEEDGDYHLLVSDGDCYVADTVSLKVLKNRLDVKAVHHVMKGDGLTIRGYVNNDSLTLLTWEVGSNIFRNVNPLVLAPSTLTRSMPFTVSTTGKCAVKRFGNIYVRENVPYAGGNDDGYVLPNDLPQLLDQCPDLLGCDTNKATLWVTAIQTEDLWYKWQKYSDVLSKWVDMSPVVGKDNVSGFDSTRLIFTSINQEDEGRYRCKLGNTYGFTFSREIRLVKGGKPVIKGRLVDNPVCVNTEILFVTSVEIPMGGTESGTGLTWKWYYSKDGVNFTKKTPETAYNQRSFSIERSKESDEGYYMVEAANFCGSAYDTAFQEVWEAPTFVKQPEKQYVCNWGSIELTTEVKGGGTYVYALWQVNVDKNGNYVSNVRRVKGELLSPLYKFNPVQTSDNGYYMWRVYNQCDSARSKPFGLTVEEEIIPIFQNVDTTFCAGNSKNLVLWANKNIENPTSTLKYSWKKDGVELASTDPWLTISRVEAADSGVYVCYARHSCEAKAIKQFRVHTIWKPVIIVPINMLPLAQNNSYCEGQPGLEMIIDYTSNAGDVKCSWFRERVAIKDNGHFSGSKTDRFVIDTLIGGDAGLYYVNLENNCGITSSKEERLQVKMPARITKQLDSAVLCTGSNLVLNVQATGYDPIVYTWLKDNVKIAGATSSSLTLKNVSYADAALYSCQVQNQCNNGMAPMTKARVHVITPKVYNLLGAGGYCGNDLLEVKLSGFEKGVTYTLKRRQRLDETNYVTLKVVAGDTVSTSGLTFGKWGSGYYHVEAVSKMGKTTCESQMNGEIHIFQHPTPESFDFYVSDPMCKGEKMASFTLSGSEGEDVLYTLQVYNERYGGWSSTSNKIPGTGEALVWSKLGKGVYRLLAENGSCKIQIGQNDTIAERPYPEVYDLYALNGDTTACHGMESDVVLQLKNSEKTCNYTLYRDNETTGRTLTGNLISWDKVEGGTYTVRAKTNYGCEKDMGHVEVTGLPQLKRWFLSGGLVFCEEVTGNKHSIVMEGSSKGIRYDFYHLSSPSPLSSLFGTGEYMVWDVELNGDETYYVVANDTVENCVQMMADSVYVEANHLTISVTPEKTINASTITNLDVDIQNAMGSPVVTWQPMSKISSIDPLTHSATTAILTKGELFSVRVADDYCVKEAMTKVLVEGEPLNAEIRASNCFTSIDTLFLCRGDNVDLCSFISGGGAKNEFKWTDDYYTDSIPVQHKSKINYTRKENKDGFVVLHVTSVVNGSTGPTLLQANDTVRIIMRERPDILLANNALNCIVPGIDTALVLTSTEAGVGYRLDFRPQQNVAYTKKDSLTGDGGVGRFEIPAYSDSQHSGYYRVIATKEYADAVCITKTEAYQLRRSPERYIVSSGAVTTYCQGERRDTIYVNQTEKDVTYRLIRDRKVMMEQRAGNDSKLTFTGSYGSGSYQVVGVLGACVDTMTNKVTIESKPRPVIQEIEGVKDYCTTDPGIKVTLLSAQSGVMYSIYKEGFYKWIAQEPSSGNDTIELGVTTSDEMPDLVGNYFVVAYDQANHCTDTVKGLVIAPTPGPLTMEKHTFSYCDNLTGYDGRQILVTGADSLIRYDLRDYSGTKIGDFIRLNKDSIYYKGVLSLPANAVSGDYDVYANAGGCSKVLVSFTLSTSIAPNDFKLLGDTLGCVGYPLTMGVQASALGVTYRLYREGVNEPLETKPGGGHLVFGDWSELGTYYVVATNAAGCGRRLSQEYVIRKQPDFFKIYTPGATSYCENERGVQLGISGTQWGLLYVLQKLDTINDVPEFRDVAGSQLIGNGSGAMLFSSYYKTGSYRVRTDYCNLLMLDTLKITERPLPASVKADYSGRACVDSVMTILVQTPEAGTNYTLKYAGLPTGLGVLPGSGIVKWDIATALTGTYSVEAERQGCTILLRDTIKPGVVAKIGNLEGIVTNKCYKDTSDLYLDVWENNAKYHLYSKTDTVTYAGKEVNGKMVFAGVDAGFKYYVSATNNSCTVEKGVFDFPGIALPVLEADNFVVADCKSDGQASILLKNLKSDYEYILAGLGDKTYTINAFAGDTLIGHLNNGTYEWVAVDPVTKCSSLPLEAVVRGGIPADSIVSRLEYCQGSDGVKIVLSGQTYGISYSLKNRVDGSLVDRDPESKIFNKRLLAGHYEFYRERVGLWGGCSASDTFNVVEYPYPAVKILNLELPSGALCEAGNNAIVIHESEKDVHYILQNSTTKANIDTIYGNGGTVMFSKRKPAGKYNILMRYKGLCESVYYKTLTVSGVPPKATAANCEYCYDVSSSAADGCALSISGLQPSAEYILYTSGGKAVDTISGMNAGFFDRMPKGDYYVTGTYAETQCSDIVAAMSVRRLTQPKVYPITNLNGGGNCAGSVEVALTEGCEGDSVRYYLYMNDFYKVEGPVKSNGNMVRFSTHSNAGSYTVHATKGVDEKCGAWMTGSVVLYARPVMAEMTVNGYNCSDKQPSGVSVTAKKTERNWFYYISDGTTESDRKEGAPNVELTWNQIGGKSLKSGRYILYSRNACDSVIAMDTAYVRNAIVPQNFKLVRTRQGVSCNSREGYSCVLEGSERGVTYTLQNKNDLFTVNGEGTGKLYLGNVFTNSAAILCTVSATVDTSQCTYVIDTLTVREDSYTENPGFTRGDSCAMPGAMITIALNKPRVPSMDYYLHVNGHAIDTILGTSMGSVTAFKPHGEFGCYSLYATSKTRQCDTIYPAPCLSSAPEERRLNMDWNGVLCDGESRKIVLLNPQPGVSYILKRNGETMRGGVNGSGESLVLGTVTKAGQYTVVARVSDMCIANMPDTVKATVLPLPELHMKKEYVYTGNDGAEIVALRPTSPQVFYQIADIRAPEVLLNSGQATEYGDPVKLGMHKEGIYVISTFDFYGKFTCVAYDTVTVKKVGVQKYNLEVIGNPYMCEANECRTLKLSGSEVGAYYELFRVKGKDTTFVSSASGTGKVIEFKSQCDTGYYYVMSTKSIVDESTSETLVSKSQMGAAVHLYVTAKIEKYMVNAIANGYCSYNPDGLPASPAGSILLQSSQSDAITYKLYCNGNLVPAREQTGTSGGAIRWTGLEGKACDKNSDAGNVYTVVATDGKCDVEMSGSVSILAVNKPMPIRQTASFNSCTGQQAAMTVEAVGCRLNYEWKYGGKVVGTSASFVIDSLKLADMGTYECTVSNYCDHFKIAPITINVREVVRMDKPMADKMVCGSTAEKVEFVSGAVGENYFWYRLGKESDTISRGSICVLNNVNEIDDAGAYVCCTWNSCGAMYDTVRLEFNRAPEVGGVEVFRNDTLCKGSPYKLSVTSRDTLYWYCDDQLIPGKHGNSLKFDSILPANAGFYKVLAKNTCNQKEFNVRRVYVDDTLRVLSAPELNKHYCQNSPINIELLLSQNSATTSYLWRKRNVVQDIKGNTFAGIVSSRDDGAWYEIAYKNKCTEGAVTHNVFVDTKISLASFAKDSVVSMCAGKGYSDVLIVDEAQRENPEYNTYRWYRRTSGMPELVGQTDTLRVLKKVAKSGIFYCELNNACGSVVSGNVDLRIDSMPIILKQPMAEKVYCQNTTLSVAMKASGGDLEYYWYIRKKKSQDRELVGYFKKGEFNSEAACKIEKLTLEHDSAKLWCAVENGCGYLVSDTVLIRVDKELKLTVDRDVAYLCADATNGVKIALSPSSSSCLRWSYNYVKVGEGNVQARNVYNQSSDTLNLPGEGIYRIYDFYTSTTKCYILNDTLDVNVKPKDYFYARLALTGKDTVCRGQSVRLRVLIQGGQAPWRLDIRRTSDRNTAPELGGVPVVVWARDTVFELNLVENQKFYIASAQQYLDPTACDGKITGDPVGYVIQQPYGTYLGKVTPDHFGSCQQLNLVSTLQPYPDVTIGKFYIDGVLSTDNILKGKPGQYKVMYKSSTSAGCADSARVTLVLDSLPSGKMSLDKDHLCTDDRANLVAEFLGKGPFSYQIKTFSYRSDGTQIGRPGSLPGTSNDFQAYTITYNENLIADSMRLYQLASVVDRYGCSYQPTDVSVKLFFHHSPLFKVEGRHPSYNNGDYLETVKDFIVPSSSRNVMFRVTLTNGAKPWSYSLTQKSLDGTEKTDKVTVGMRDDIERLITSSGTLTFRVNDAHCPSATSAVRTVTQLDSGYLRVKVILQGAYSSVKKAMESELWNQGLLPKKKWAAWPNTGSRKGIDWVTVELRKDSINGAKFFSDEFLLLSDGSVIDRYGRETLPVPNADFTTPYHVVIKHRNHLAIGSATGVLLASKTKDAKLMDLRLIGNVYCSRGNEITTHLCYIGQVEMVNVWGMYPGNMFGNSLISVNNANEGILKEILTPGYYKADVNFDGKVTLPQNLQAPTGTDDDVSLMYQNRDKYSEIIE